MRKVVFGVILLLTLKGVAQVTKPIGINIAAVSDYSTELVFTDAFKQCRKWIISNADGSGPWDSQISVPLNLNGYPLEIPYSDGVHPPQLAKTLMLWDIGLSVPQGMYRLKIAGNGQVRLSFGAFGTFNCPIDTFVNVTGQVMLEILVSNVANPINDIKFIYPDYVNRYQTQTFTDEFVDFLEDFQVIRFMDFTHTNGSPIISWSDRTSPLYYSQAKFGGVAWEYVIDLANQTQKDIWINIPHKADDNYIQQLASLLQNNLNANTKIYLEYSNELWNSAFSQNADCAAFAQNIGYVGQPWERAWKYTAKRSADVFKLFEDVFMNDQRLVKVIPSQAVNSWLTNQLVTFFNDPIYNPHRVSANAIAIAPYFGHEVADNIVSSNQVNSITVPQIMQELQNALNSAYQAMDDNKTVAITHNLQLICYEGGQHLVATGNNVNNATLTPKLMATNHDAALESLYCDYFDHWYTSVGGLFCHFSSHGTYSKWGSWGVRENFQDVNNPKYLALGNCVFNANVTSTNGGGNQGDAISVYPNPTSESLTVMAENYVASEFSFHLIDCLGRQLVVGSSRFGDKVYLPKVPKGLYILLVLNGENQFSEKVLVD